MNIDFVRSPGCNQRGEHLERCWDCLCDSCNVMRRDAVEPGALCRPVFSMWRDVRGYSFVIMRSILSGRIECMPRKFTSDTKLSPMWPVFLTERNRERRENEIFKTIRENFVYCTIISVTTTDGNHNSICMVQGSNNGTKINSSLLLVKSELLVRI